MRIAILGSVALPVPPPMQGGTEWIAYHQAKGLSQRGHEVTLFAAKGSMPGNYKLIEAGRGDTVSTTFARVPLANGVIKGQIEESSRQLRKETTYLAEVCYKLIEYKDDYDIILNNMRGEAVFAPLARQLGKKYVTVLHLPLFKELAAFLKNHQVATISISNNQRKSFPDLNYLATVYNGVDTNRFAPIPYALGKSSDYYLLMMGTIGRHKNQEAAIQVAKTLGMRLVLAGKVRDEDYFLELSKEIDGKQIVWRGEMQFEEKLTLYQKAYAFIFPVLWDEPFGLVMIEAMACGTPVVAFGNGAVPEVVVNGKTGFVVENNDIGVLIDSMKQIDKIDRAACRKHVEENFSVEKMVADYEKALLKL